MVKLGRPPKTAKCDIIINDLIVQHISTKKDNYNKEVCYLKIVDESFKTKFKMLLAAKLKDDSLTLPIWANNGEYILKVKNNM